MLRKNLADIDSIKVIQIWSTRRERGANSYGKSWGKPRIRFSLVLRQRKQISYICREARTNHKNKPILTETKSRKQESGGGDRPREKARRVAVFPSPSPPLRLQTKKQPVYAKKHKQTVKNITAYSHVGSLSKNEKNEKKLQNIHKKI